jgi:hypothetical protein
MQAPNIDWLRFCILSYTPTISDSTPAGVLITEPAATPGGSLVRKSSEQEYVNSSPPRIIINENNLIILFISLFLIVIKI